MNTWRDLIKAYSLAQLDYPEGLGMHRTLKVKIRLMDWRSLNEIPLKDLQLLIKTLREEYVKLTIRENSGESIRPDTDPYKRNDFNKNPRKNGSWREKIR